MKRSVKARKYISPAKRNQVYDRDGHSCLCCGSVDALTVDHIVPVAKGGDNDIDNLQTLCDQCNVQKGSKVVDYRSTSKKRPGPVKTDWCVAELLRQLEKAREEYKDMQREYAKVCGEIEERENRKKSIALRLGKKDIYINQLNKQIKRMRHETSNNTQISEKTDQGL